MEFISDRRLYLMSMRMKYFISKLPCNIIAMHRQEQDWLNWQSLEDRGKGCLTRRKQRANLVIPLNRLSSLANFTPPFSLVKAEVADKVEKRVKLSGPGGFSRLSSFEGHSPL